jgi:phage tail sheath protein FI
MPEHLTPGVHVEETSFRPKSIEGVSTTTAGFIGPTRTGPIDLKPDAITSLGEFERVYGDGKPMQFGASSPTHNFVWHAARAFFEEGGKRLYVVRVFKPLKGADADPEKAECATPPETIEADPVESEGLYEDGHARAWLPSIGPPPAGGERTAIEIRARFPGAQGNLRVTFALRIGQNILTSEDGQAKVSGLLDHSLVWIGNDASAFGSPPGNGALYMAESRFEEATKARTWLFQGDGNTLELDSLHPETGDVVRIVTLAVTVTPADSSSFPLVWDGLQPDPAHERDGSPDSLTAVFAPVPSNLAQARTLPIVILAGKEVKTGVDVVQTLLSLSRPGFADPDRARSVEVLLAGGNDGQRPLASEYEGKADDSSRSKTGLRALEDVDDVSIVAAPGSTLQMEESYRSEANTVVNLLIAHASRLRYRIAVLDSGARQSIAQVRAMRAKIDSSYAALYYPWVRVLDPVTGNEIDLPPSGFVAGIYARNDVTRGVSKAPANEVVNLATGLEQLLDKGQQDVLNSEGINSFRFFEGRGFLLWGARTVSSDPEWKYVNLRRYFAYLEHSIDKGTQWAVFETNGEALWAKVRSTIGDFLLNEWQSGALLGEKPEKAYFVRCDRSTMTQNDVDNGRLVVLIGVAPLRPAEFVIFRIGQWTADHKP